MSKPSLARIFDLLNAHQKSMALATALDVDLFTAIGEGHTTEVALADRCKIHPRGARILCDFLVVNGLLQKENGAYACTEEAALFLDRRARSYSGSIRDFQLSAMMIEGFHRLTDAVRTGRTGLSEAGSTEKDFPTWVTFARAMAGSCVVPAKDLATLLALKDAGECKVLDLAASHGIYGIQCLLANPRARAWGVDWGPVLDVAKENATKYGVADRYDYIPGSAFEVPLGEAYDIALVTNILHHFDAPTCVTLLRRVHDSLRPGGVAAILDFIPNDDLVTPPGCAAFALTMLATTPHGDAHSEGAIRAMCTEAGYASSMLHDLPRTINRVVVARRA